MKSIKKLLAGLYGSLLSRSVSAFDNATVTPAYAKARAGYIWEAWQMPYEAALGAWFDGGMIFLPAASMFIHQKSLNISAMWLLCGLAAYGSEIADLPGYVFYLFIVAWIALALIKLLAIKYHS